MPLLEASVAGRKALAIVEGEINALSLAACYPPFDVVSPGGAATFAAKKYLNFYKQYDKIIIIADADSAGLKAAIELKTEALKWTPKVSVVLMEHDCNDILQSGGISKLRLEMEKWVGLWGS
jgi:DNA primase